jgi:hypothetical protein
MQYDSSPDWLINFLIRNDHLLEVVISASVACVQMTVESVSLNEFRFMENNWK